jgi:Raf kinase inhibitor-like YbhB/YbcL family protein
MAGTTRRIVTAVLALLLWGSASGAQGMTLASPAFKDGDKLPRTASCDGGDRSPALTVNGAPAGSKSLALLVSEVDGHKTRATLWMACNIPPATQSIPEHQGRTRQMKPEGLQLNGSNGKLGYSGPCPPSGVTRQYMIEVFALDTTLELPETATRQEFLLALEGHILAKAKLAGKFKK